jgi:hypothetical protein
MLFIMVMNEIIRRTEGQTNGVPKVMVYAVDIVIWEPNESISEKKFERIIIVCTNFGLSVNLDKYVVMKIIQKTGHAKDYRKSNKCRKILPVGEEYT